MQSKRKRAWLTPDSGEALADLICRRFFVPDTPAFRESVSGALLELTYSWNWEQFGTMTPEEAAAVMLTMYNRYALDDACTEETVEAPYWDEDSADDADDTAPADDQPWYGQLVTDGFTWQEQLSVWIVTAFVAYAATPAAAIAFLPIANRFVLEFKKHDLGGIVRVLVDAVEVGRVDTYSATPGVIEMPVAALPSGGMGSEEMFPTLIIAMADEYNPLITGTPNIQVIRKRLTPDEITPRDLRYNPDTNIVERTWDDGASWVAQPDADPRHSDAFRQPERTDENARCNAAQGMADYVRHTINIWLEAATLAQAATGILEIILLLAGGAGIIFDLIILALETLATIGEATIEAAFTDTVYDDLKCAFYCHIDHEGQMSASQLADFLAQVNTEHPGTVYNVVSTIANMTGEVLFSNAGVESTVTGECSACAELCPDRWSKTWNWGTTDYRGELDTAIDLGDYISGSGIASVEDPRDRRYGGTQWHVIAHWGANYQPTVIDHFEYIAIKPYGFNMLVETGVSGQYPAGFGVVMGSGDGTFYDHSDHNNTSQMFVPNTQADQGQKLGMVYVSMTLGGTGHCPFVNPDP